MAVYKLCGYRRWLVILFSSITESIGPDVGGTSAQNCGSKVSWVQSIWGLSWKRSEG